MILYKFQACETASETITRLQSILDEPYIWASPITSFNDPFEFKVAMEWPTNIEDTRSRYFRDNPSSSENDFQEWFKDLTENHKWYIANSLRLDLLNKFSVCCLTNKMENHLLWSHYAKNHKGICIGYEINTSKINNYANLFSHGNVTYHKEKEKFNYFKESIDSFLKKACFHKSYQWKYEKEYRLLFTSPGKQKLPRGSVKEVYLGCRCSSEIRTFIDGKLNTNGTSFYQMHEDPFNYKIIKEKITKNRILTSSAF